MIFIISRALKFTGKKQLQVLPLKSRIDMKTVQLKDAERSLAKASDSEFIRGFDKNGNSILIDKSDLADVLGELMREKKIFTFSDRERVKDLDLATSTGFYTVTGDSINVPSGTYSYGTLLVYGLSFIIQMYIPHADGGHSKHGVRIRVRHINIWTDWRLIRFDES